MSDLLRLKINLNTPGLIAPTIDKFRTNDNIILNTGDYNCEGVIFEDCYFKELELNGIDLKYGIKFVRTRFIKLIIRECTANGFKIGFNKNNSNLKFDECSFSHSLEITNCEFDREIQVKNCKNVNDINITNNRATGIGFYKSTIKNISSFNNNVCHSEIRFDNSEFQQFIRLENNCCSSLTFIDSIFKKDIWVWAGKTAGITLNQGVYEDTFTIEAVDCSGSITISDVDFKKDCKITFEDITNKKTGSCKKIHIKSSRFSEGLLIDGKIGNDLMHVEEIQIQSTNGLSGLVNISNFSVQNVLLKGLNSNSIIVFDNIKTQNLEVSGYSNYSTTRFLNITASTKHDSKLTILNSHLGETLFSNFDFKSFEKSIIANSLFTEITAANVTWFEPKQIFNNDSSKKAENNVLRELFRQLKFAMEKQGDYVQSIVFKRYEYKSFHKETRKKAIWKALNDNLTLWFGSVNRHGTNWAVPLTVMAVLTFISSTLITLSYFNLFHPDLSLYGIKNLLSIINLNIHHYFFQFFDPTFKLEEIYGCSSYEITVSMNLLSFCHRVFLSIFIYQTIVAFRKYSK